MCDCAAAQRPVTIEAPRAMDANVEQKVEERLGSLELEVKTLRVLMERHLSSLLADTLRAPTNTDA
jgi:hypothetical protein